MGIRRVAFDEMLLDWDFYEYQIGRVVRRVRAGCDTEHVLTCLQVGTMQLWRDEARKGIAVTEIQTYPLYRVLLIFMVAGRDVRDLLTDGQQQLDSFAKQSNCKFVEFIGRPGWEKLVDGLGYTEKFIRMRKEV